MTITEAREEFGEIYVIENIDEPERSALSKWMIGQTGVLIEDNGVKFGVYPWDYERFKAYYDKGKEAPIYD